MYLSFYKLKEFPFALSSDEKYFFESSIHAEGLANMMYTVQQRKGMVLITGEVGAGKTFLGNMLGAKLGPSSSTVAIPNPPQSGKQLLRALALRLGMQVRQGADKLTLSEDLEHHLIRHNRQGRLVVMLLDECQDYTTASLEEIRLLWNWEQNGQRLVQIVLIGQPEFRQRLAEPLWESLRQRIVLSYHLGQLTSQDSGKYIAHRLKIASLDGGPEVEFTDTAVGDIHDASSGTPRLINILCDNALLVGYAKSTRCIDRGIVSDVLRNMTCWGMRPASDKDAGAVAPS